MKNHSARLDRPGRPPLLPCRAEQDEPGIATEDVHRHCTAPRRADDDIRLVPVELSLGDLDGLVEILVRQFWVDDFVAVMGKERRFDAAWDRLPTVEEEDSHAGI